MFKKYENDKKNDGLPFALNYDFWEKLHDKLDSLNKIKSREKWNKRKSCQIMLLEYIIIYYPIMCFKAEIFWMEKIKEAFQKKIQ